MTWGRTISEARARDKARGAFFGAVAVGVLLVVAWPLRPPRVRALGDAGLLDLRGLDYDGGRAEPRPGALRRLAWEVRRRTSVETLLAPTRVRLTDPSLFEQPVLWWSGDRAFPPLPEPEIVALRRYLTLGGFVVVDDAAPETPGFDASVRRDLARALPRAPLRPLAATHTVYRSFFLLDRPVGRVEGPDHLEAIRLEDRVALVYARHDLGGALERDDFGVWAHRVEPGGDRQRERATRLAINVVLYALCLGYKDDQVHAPFIMRRRAGAP
jgi:hypothetical protein